MVIKKPIPDKENWSASEIIQIICGFILAIVVTIITFMLFRATADIYSPSGLQELEGTYEYGLGTLLLGWIPAVIGMFTLPLNILLWSNAVSNKLKISYLSLALFFIIIVVGKGNKLLSSIFIPLILINILLISFQRYHISKNKLAEKDE
ncbi:MAG TPA: hypothetical protein VK071_07690 [Tissierellales bacterium]|nr:hypothetical protein [Tissierellales bacterium]